MPDSDAKNPSVVVVGAGFAGLFLLYRLRNMGLSARAFEAGSDVGGTWYWNRYPGARCDIESIDYSYSFDPELEQEWEWTEKYATQPEILSYAQHVANKYDLRRDITFNTRVVKSLWDEKTSRWQVTTDNGETTYCQFFIMATGCLSQPKELDIKGTDNFNGEIYRTHSWPHDGVEFTGKRVGIIGTGSSGIQSIPHIAAEAESTTVFQRTANYSIPAGNGPISEEKLAIKNRYQEYREEARWTPVGVPKVPTTDYAFMVSDEERNERYEALWSKGAIPHLSNEFADLMTDKRANDTFAEFARAKIRSVVNDPDLAETLTPTSYPICAKRTCLDSGYYETFNKNNVNLVDIRKNPIAEITETGIKTQDTDFEFDAIVFATGFDAMTGALLAIDIHGRERLSLRDKWADGPVSYLGLAISNFPNLFTVTGPGSPSVLSNMMVSIEQHVEWITDCIAHMEAEGLQVIEATTTAENAWVNYGTAWADLTLFPLANSWYMGANVPGKPRVCLPYVGGVGGYRRVCNDVVAQDYLGFEFTGPQGKRCNDGLVRRQQPDVVAMLEAMAEMNLPAMETLSPADARAMSIAMNAGIPPGPAVGEVSDGSFPGADGSLEYRLYRPDTPGPHPVVLYFHGGGWLFGDHTSDDAYCRDLCVRSNTMIMSVNYRHAPENPFPAAHDDGFAALQWIAENSENLGGAPGELLVCGWSAGGGIAASVCQRARDIGAPAIKGQILITPALDATDQRAAVTENAEGFGLSQAMMDWFWNLYANDTRRDDPKLSPLHATNLANLPPAFIVTAEFDPLRDQGRAYADALKAAGSTALNITYPGQIHTSFASVGVILSANGARQDIAENIQRFFQVLEPA